MEPSSDDRATSVAAPTSKGRIVIPSRIRRNVVLEPLQIPIKLKGGLKEMATVQDHRSTDRGNEKRLKVSFFVGELGLFPGPSACPHLVPSAPFAGDYD